jgi:hypothetical protein
LQKKLAFRKAKYPAFENLGSDEHADKDSSPGCWRESTRRRPSWTKENWCGALQEVVLDTRETAGALPHSFPLVSINSLLLFPSFIQVHAPK